ncbi:hypothetical protein P3X46_024889 [Hevea brasiliensis]|uniref:Uncharacterized protein n=1 Tax=Hevea brasiliensis TaxID=3981 RepID=A0ABQ9L5N2_HEVBR|nr:uncharacterized protein LOC110637272 [Hevea brasiliensis]KAJ9159380.1 hypothetical protein P3X46_024889 [Hevea brasiliensis]
MRSKANKQSKLMMEIILAPIKILSKARDFYMKSMVDCAGRVGYTTVVFGGPVASQSVQLPKSFSVSSSSQGSKNNEELRQLLQGSGMESLDMMNSRQRQQVRIKAMESGDMGRCYSVGLGKIGKIDEEKACSFREDEDLCPRSRCHALRRSVVYYC